jgi:hypothetical protein
MIRTILRHTLCALAIVAAFASSPVALAAAEKTIPCLPKPSPSWQCPNFQCVYWHQIKKCCVKWRCLWRNPLRRSPAGD